MLRQLSQYFLLFSTFLQPWCCASVSFSYYNVALLSFGAACYAREARSIYGHLKAGTAMAAVLK